MCHGELGPGVSYWALIRISGDLKQDALEKIHDEIEAKLENAQLRGKITTEARVSDKDVKAQLQFLPTVDQTV